MKAIIALISALLTISSYYPECGIVTDVTLEDGREEWDTTVTFQTMNGNLFSFYGGEDLEVGDVIALIMNDNGTLEVTDDIVIDVKYCSPINVNITY